MGLESILEAIRAEEQSLLQAVDAQTQTEVTQILTLAKQEAEAIEADARRAVMTAAMGEKSRIIHGATLQAGQIIGAAQQAVFDKVLDQVRSRLAELRTAATYPDLLRHLVHEALAVLEESLQEHEHPHIKADPRDREVLGGILSGMPRLSIVKYELESWGGVQVLSPDGRVVVDNTLETRLETAAPYLSRILPVMMAQASAQPSVKEQGVATP